MGNFLFIISLFVGLRPKGLRSISARGEEAKGISDTPAWIDVDYEFDNLNIHWTTEPPKVPGVKDKSIGAYFEGDKGTLICDYGSMEIKINGKTLTDFEQVPISIKRSPGHQQNFIDSVKSRKQPESNLEYSRMMTLPMHLGLISWRLGESLKWNPEKEKFIGNARANMLLSRKARKAWKLI